MTISLCMIVKNESVCLPRALANWRELADELIIVDTGSTDDTVAIAERHGATVLHYEWVQPGHKGEARQMGIDAAAGEWIVVLDADEIITDPAGLRQVIHDSPPERTGIHVLFENYDDAGKLTLRWYQNRIFRRGLYCYRHREHEMPVWHGAGEPAEFGVNIVFEHRAPAGRGPIKAGPMLERLRLDVEEHPGDPHPIYFLHRQYMLMEDWKAGIEWGTRYLALESGRDPCECYGNLASCHYMLGDIQGAIRWLHNAAAEQPHRRIWWIRLAEMHMAAGRWNIGLAHLRLASELWPAFEWQWEPETYGPGLQALIDKCQRALADMHHIH